MELVYKALDTSFVVNMSLSILDPLLMPKTSELGYESKLIIVVLITNHKHYRVVSA